MIKIFFRCIYQLKIWYSSHLKEVVVEEPGEYGWKLDESSWRPILTMQDPVPDEVRKALSIRCSDKNCNNNRCTCLVQGLKCCSECKYTTCSNSPQDEINLSDSEFEDF